MPATHLQNDIHAASLANPEAFWSKQANHLTWHKRPSSALRRQKKHLKSGSHDHWTWFPDGEISTTENCVDRHVRNGQGDNVAIIYDSPVTGKKEKFTYSRLLDEVEVLAGVLREQGVRIGDVVLVYSALEMHTFLSRPS
jgi:propionyl-CoA synthetase